MSEFVPMQTPVDINSKTEIRISRLKIARAILGGLGLMGFGYWMTRATEGRAGYSVEMLHLAGEASMAFFGIGVLSAFVWLLTQSSPVITLSPQGLRDARISPDIIPWRSVAAILTWEHAGQRQMLLKLHTDAQDKLRLTEAARSSRRLNASLGADGLVVASGGLRIDYSDLVATTIAYHVAYGHRS